ncbi:MAG TPA: hypothetical protein VLK33_07685 [Terriglobales bacterium]|nr:hypothetical protein [Terriglobales bacterium]
MACRAPRDRHLFGSNCQSKDFADYIPFWKHNGYWFFDSPEIIKKVAAEHSIPLEGISLFYYEVYEMEFDGEGWHSFSPESSFLTNVFAPAKKHLEGFDVANFTARTSPECSGLSCSNLASELPTNTHCLFASFSEAKTNLDNGSFNDSEPGPFRIFAVYSVDWA